jgi:hypothetical protein
MIGLFVDEADGGIIAVEGPIDAACPEILADGFDGAQEFSLLNGERANGKIDGRALLQEQEGFQHGHGILTAGDGGGHAIAFANHAETLDSFANLPQ